MDLQDMISKMNPQMLSQGLKKVSSMLTPQQLKEMENAIKTVDKGTLNQKLNSLSAQDLQRELQNNPNLAKQLAQNPALMSQLSDIFKKNK